MIRKPVVSGQFYPNEQDDLKMMIKQSFEHKFGPGKQPPIDSNEEIFGVISPHAGYMYSGPTACHSYYSISSQSPELVIIIGPNHFGIGSNAATMGEAKWETPLGLVEVDYESALELEKNSDIIQLDYFSHSKDHSLEVQIPILQTIFSNKFQILPIILLAQDLKTANDVGLAVAKIARNKKSVIIGSSDFTHYEENSFAHIQDKALIETILHMDIEKFYGVLKEKRVSACGFGAIASTMIACKELGSTRGELLNYATSGDVVGNKESVVGYGSIKFV
jgi:hypothetical protein